MAEQTATPTFRCEVCGRRYAWTPERAGTTITCECLEPIAVPSEPEGDLYDLAPVPVEPIKAGEVVVAADVPHSPTLSYQRPGEVGVDERYSEANPLIASTWKDLVFPTSIIVIGTLAQVAFQSRLGGSRGVFWAVGTKFIADVVVMLVGIVAAAKALEVSFGPVPTAILKLGAIALAPGGLVAVVGLVFGLSMWPLAIAWLVGLVVYYVLFWYLFDLDPEDVWQTVLMVFGIRMISGFFM